jgi:hypothetical protein
MVSPLGRAIKGLQAGLEVWLQWNSMPIYNTITKFIVHIPVLPKKSLKACTAENKIQTYHFFGMFFTQRCLVCNVKNWHRALLPICKLGGATREELLRAVQEDIWVCQVKNKTHCNSLFFSISIKVATLLIFHEYEFYYL